MVKTLHATQFKSLWNICPCIQDLLQPRCRISSVPVLHPRDILVAKHLIHVDSIEREFFFKFFFRLLSASVYR